MCIWDKSISAKQFRCFDLLTLKDILLCPNWVPQFLLCLPTVTETSTHQITSLKPPISHHVGNPCNCSWPTTFQSSKFSFQSSIDLRFEQQRNSGLVFRDPSRPRQRRDPLTDPEICPQGSTWKDDPHRDHHQRGLGHHHQEYPRVGTGFFAQGIPDFWCYV